MTKYLISLLFLFFPGSVLAASEDTASKALEILRTHCYSCHGVNHRGGDLKYDVTNLSYLVSPSSTLIVPGSPEKSRILARIQAGEMPPKPKPGVTSGELGILTQWVKEGAKAPGQERPKIKVVQNPPRAKNRLKIIPPPGKKAFEPVSPKFITDNQIRQVIVQDTLRYGGYASNLRYVSLVTLYNTEADERLLSHTRAAVSKTLNALSFALRIYIPQPVDKQGLILRIDLTQIGWTAADWDQILNIYPYNGSPTFIRADWFVANALRPPLYYNLLHFPDNLKDFERKLGINRDRNFLFNLSQRAAINNSGVAFHNRVLEYDPGIFGPYWISYDFGSDADKENVIRNPLGPKTNANPFVNADFENKANEILAGLPNGFDAYYVANAAGNRLDFADPALVTDTSQVSRTATIVPGISCITCHSQGKQIKILDVARNGSPLNGLEQLKLLALYPDSKKFTRILERDRDRYNAAAKQAIEPFLGKDAVSASGVTEPIRTIAEHYNKPITLEQAALEVGVKPEALKQLIYTSGELQQLGLRPLLDSHTITRETWENIEFGVSPFQRILLSFGL